MPKEPNGLILYRGESRLDGEQIMAIVTGLKTPSNNPKTGWMAQVWIMRSNMHPHQAVLTNSEKSVCGDCPMRGDSGKERICYVNQMTLGQIYSAYERGLYPDISGRHMPLMKNRALRIGAYGDPASVPIEIWTPFLENAGNAVVTAYTHQWEYEDSQVYRSFCMASVETEAEALKAWKLGWRTYRVKLSEQPVLTGEMICPASNEREHSTTCSQCGICDGGRTSKQGNVVINVHGARPVVNREIFRREKTS